MCSQSASPITVVLVDDHSLLRQGVTSMLSGFEDVEIIGEAEDGFKGLRLIGQKQPDVAILDIGMQGISGLEMIPSVTSISTKTKIVMYSMHDDSNYIQQAMHTGALGYVLKLDPPHELETAVRQVNAGHIYLSPAVSAKAIDLLILGSRAVKYKDSTGLTPREQVVASLIGQGFDTAKLAEILFISPNTVRVHRANIMKKMNCSTTSELIVRLHNQLKP